MNRLTAILFFALLGLASFVPAQAGEGVFSDNFKGVMTRMPDHTEALFPDRQKWAFNFWPGSVWPDSYGDGTNWLPANGEGQAYLNPFLSKVLGKAVPLALRYNPFSFKADGLHITASLLSPAQQDIYKIGGHRRFGSGMLRSKASFTYGKIRMVAKLPSARGSWSALWLLPVARTWPPEIDIFEGMSWNQHAQQIHLGTVPTKKDAMKPLSKWFDLGVDPSKDFHEYGLDWTKDTLTFYFDGRVLTTTPTPPSMNQPMYLLANLAVGGKWPYNELRVQPIDGMDPERLARGADLIESDYPAALVIRSITVEALSN